MAEVEKGISNPLPTTSPAYEDLGGAPIASIPEMAQVLGVLELILEQLQFITGLEAGEAE